VFTNGYLDDRVFKRGNEFIPERFTSQQELTVDASVFTPFSVGMLRQEDCFNQKSVTDRLLGRYSCVGKHLALMEVRTVTAHIIRRYNVELAPGVNPKSFLDGKKDTFTLSLGPLPLVFKERKL